MQSSPMPMSDASRLSCGDEPFSIQRVTEKTSSYHASRAARSSVMWMMWKFWPIVIMPAVWCAIAESHQTRWPMRHCVSRREVGCRGSHRLASTLRLFPFLLAPERGEIEEVVRAADRLEAARVLRIRVVHVAVELQEAAAARHVVRLLGRLHALVTHRRVLVERSVVVLVEA